MEAYRALGCEPSWTCAPYQAGHRPAFGSDVAWGESNAVVFCNSVIGGRTNCEGRESTSAAMLAKRIPDWGFHRDEFRRGQNRVRVEAGYDDWVYSMRINRCSGMVDRIKKLYPVDDEDDWGDDDGWYPTPY